MPRRQYFPLDPSVQRNESFSADIEKVLRILVVIPDETAESWQATGKYTAEDLLGVAKNELLQAVEILRNPVAKYIPIDYEKALAPEFRFGSLVWEPEEERPRAGEG